MSRSFAIAAAALLLVAAIMQASCSSDAAEPVVQATQTPEVVAVRGMGEPHWASHQGESLATMLRYYPAVFVADVVDVRTEQTSRVPPELRLTPYPTIEGKPDGSQLLSPPVSIYTLQVIEALTAEAPAAGGTVQFANEGGDVLVGENQVERWVAEGDELPIVGQRYLFFAVESTTRAGAFNSAPWGKFRIQNGVVEAPGAWTSLGVASLAGANLTAAANAITLSEAD